MSYLRYLCLLAHGGVQHIVRCVLLCLVHPMLPVSLDCLRPVSCAPYVTSFSGLSSSCVLCTLCYQFLWIVFVLCLVQPMLPVSLDCPFVIVLSVFSNVYLIEKPI